MNAKTKLFTIGFTRKSAKAFFEALTLNKVKTVIDIRLNNTSQLAGYAKKADLEYFLESLCKIEYVHSIDFAPTDELLKRYKNKEISWKEFERLFRQLLAERRPERGIPPEKLDSACLLCSEPTAVNCHRRIVAEYLESIYKNMEIVHI